MYAHGFAADWSTAQFYPPMTHNPDTMHVRAGSEQLQANGQGMLGYNGRK